MSGSLDDAAVGSRYELWPGVWGIVRSGSNVLDGIASYAAFAAKHAPLYGKPPVMVVSRRQREVMEKWNKQLRDSPIPSWSNFSI